MKLWFIQCPWICLFNSPNLLDLKIQRIYCENRSVFGTRMWIKFGSSGRKIKFGSSGWKVKWNSAQLAEKANDQSDSRKKANVQSESRKALWLTARNSLRASDLIGAFALFWFFSNLIGRLLFLPVEPNFILLVSLFQPLEPLLIFTVF